MNNKTILDLNDKCLGDILAYLDMEDHGNFAQVCQRFRQVFVTWSAKQYKDFKTELMNMKLFFIISENVKILRVEFCKIRDILKKHSCVHRHIMFLHFCEQFQNMKALKRLELRFDTDCDKILTHLNICDEMVKFLKDLPHLTELQIVSNYESGKYNLNAFCELKLLTSFSADWSIEINLKEFCKSNENLSYLKLFGDYDGNISDSVPFCSNLKTLEFTSQNIVNYASLAELPQLQVLTIYDLIYSAETKEMFQKFASTKLRQLILWRLSSVQGRYVDLEGTKEICKIKSLSILVCNFEDNECVKYVAQLTNLKELIFNTRNNSVDFSDSLRHILRECKQMEYMQIYAAGVPQNFVFQAFIVLEGVRNPQEQKPLELRLPWWKYDLSSEDKELFKSYIDFKKL